MVSILVQKQHFVIITYIKMNKIIVSLHAPLISPFFPVLLVLEDHYSNIFSV